MDTGGIARTLYPLLDHLAARIPTAPLVWGDWQITPVGGGANNRLFRATGREGDLAVKFTVRDSRDRAGREYHSLSALRAADLAIAPQPILLDRQRYAQPVVVTTWLAGPCGTEPPAEDDDWAGLLAHFHALHGLVPDVVATALPDVVLTMRTVEDGLAAIGAQIGRLPAASRPRELVDLVGRVERSSLPHWPMPQARLCRGDSNISNFIIRPGTWASVDWEYAGWGDTAFELADLITHPAYGAVSRERREWLIARYCADPPDRLSERRIRTYIPLMLVWWVARFARMLYEVPRGLDERLVTRPPDWAEHATRQYERYLARATDALAERW